VPPADPPRQHPAPEPVPEPARLDRSALHDLHRPEPGSSAGAVPDGACAQRASRAAATRDPPHPTARARWNRSRTSCDGSRSSWSACCTSSRVTGMPPRTSRRLRSRRPSVTGLGLAVSTSRAPGSARLPSDGSGGGSSEASLRRGCWRSGSWADATSMSSPPSTLSCGTWSGGCRAVSSRSPCCATNLTWGRRNRRDSWDLRGHGKIAPVPRPQDPGQVARGRRRGGTQ
jgi:hypothetical protein